MILIDSALLDFKLIRKSSGSSPIPDTSLSHLQSPISEQRGGGGNQVLQFDTKNIILFFIFILIISHYLTHYHGY